MMIRLNVFKRLIKQAWKKERLIVGADYEEYFIECGYFVIRINKQYMPKGHKAALIELMGDLPEAGEIFKVGKDKEPVTEFKDIWLLEDIDIAERDAWETNVYVSHKGTMLRMLQSGDKNMFITADFVNMIDREVDREVETDVVGPCLVETGDSRRFARVYYKNNICKYMALTRMGTLSREEEDILNTLSVLELEGIYEEEV